MRDTLNIQKVTKVYDDFKALDQVSLDVASGEFMTLLGPSGSGKTTLLMAIAGFTLPTMGQIILDQVDITSLPPDKRNFGLVFQGYALFPHMTVAQNVGYPLRIRKLSKSDTDKKIHDILELIQLAHLSDRYPSQLSGGQQQRVALARAIVFQPELLLLDEPLSALDRALRKDLQQELKDIHDRVGTTFIYVTHDQEEALSMSNRIAILHNGQIVQVGTPEDLYEQPVNIFVANFLGKSNFLQASEQHKNADKVEYKVGNASFVICSQRVPAEIGQEFSVALRPERLRLHDPTYSQPQASVQNRIPGVISKVSYFGQNYEVIVATELAGDLMVTVPLGGSRPTISEHVQVIWDHDAGVALNGRPETSDDAYAS